MALDYQLFPIEQIKEEIPFSILDPTSTVFHRNAVSSAKLGHPVLHSYLTQSVCEGVLQKSILQKSVSIFLILVITENELTDLCENRLLQNDSRFTLCEMNSLSTNAAAISSHPGDNSGANRWFI